MEDGFAKEYMEKFKEGLDKIEVEKVREATSLLYGAWKEGRQVFIFGNGGSASTASHFACDLGKGTLKRHYEDTETRFRVVSLVDNIATMTAYGNDHSFEDIFAQQLKNLVKENDVVIAITGSGNSPNVVKAVGEAKKRGAKTIAFLGFDGGKVRGLADVSIIFPDTHYGRIEDSHLLLEHLICSYLKEKINSEE